MASCRVSMKKPVCLIDTGRDGRLCINPSALSILEQIDQHVVVVAVVGLYRTGKSYLMNKLAGRNKGFPLGSTIQSKTKGIWMWCVPHPKKVNHTLVLLDTEGLGDVEKGDTKNDTWIFAMAVLLSSTLVYNSMGTINNKALEKLHYVTTLTEHIKIKSETDDDQTYTHFLPSFVWAVRDFSLDLELDGKPITADEYLENALKQKPGKGNEQYNQPRNCLRKFFLHRSCFVFERPGNKNTLKRLEEMTDADLEPEFVQQANDFTEHIYTKSETKTLDAGQKVTGSLLGKLADTYVNAIRSGKIPCLENAVVALSEIENAKAVEQALDHYVQKMKSVRYPTNTKEELSAVHQSSEREAVAIFMKYSFRDKDQKYQHKIVKVLQDRYKHVCEKNCQESRKACERIIKRIFEPLEAKLRSGLYTTTGGYYQFSQDLTTMTNEYRREKGKGVKAAEVLMTYLDEKAAVGQTIMAADKRLSEAERKAKEGKAKRAEAERQALIAAESLCASEKRKAHLKKTHEENMRQLMEKMDRDTKAAQEQHDKIMIALLMKTNLLKNPNGEEHMESWELTKNGGCQWRVEDLPGDCGHDFCRDGVTKYFATSFQLCLKRQVIDLQANGYSPRLLDAQPPVTVEDWYCGRTDCGCTYEINVCLLDENKKVLQRFQPGTVTLNPTHGCSWKQVRHTFTRYGRGLRFISFEHGGEDTKNWHGWYGVRVTGSSVTIKA